MFGNSKSSNSLNTNSTIMTWYSKQCKLVIGAWNDKISIKFYESTGQDSNGLTTYADKPVSTALTQENASILYSSIKDEVLPHFFANDDEEIGVTVPIGTGDNQNALSIERRKNENGAMVMVLEFIKGIGPDGKANSGTQVLTYEFNTMEYMINFDPNTGEGVTKTSSGQFITFCNILKSRINLLQLNTHAQKHLENMRSSFGGNGGPSRPSSSASGSFGDAFNSLEEELPFQ